MGAVMAEMILMMQDMKNMMQPFRAMQHILVGRSDIFQALAEVEFEVTLRRCL